MSSTGLPSNLPAHYTPSSASSSGGQGKVVRCRDGNLSRDVAIKVLHTRGNPLDLAAEVAALSSIQSKHVVQVFDVIVDGAKNIVALVQEYLPGDDLSGFSAAGASLNRYLQVLFQVASGIADIHGSGKIHRDIKPENMRFDSEGILKIFDFGLACDRRGNPATLAARGTHGYRAPELYPSGGTFTEAVDVYAFGVLAWELAGAPFPSVLLEFPPQSSGSVSSISTHPRSIPAEICAIIDLTLSLTLADRPNMEVVRDVIARRLMYGRHKATITSGGRTYDLFKPGGSIKISHGSYGRIEIEYDGLEFKVKSFEGAVYINGVLVSQNMCLPDSCVLIIGETQLGASRLFLPFNSSHPEVVL